LVEVVVSRELTILTTITKVGVCVVLLVACTSWLSYNLLYTCIGLPVESLSTYTSLAIVTLTLIQLNLVAVVTILGLESASLSVVVTSLSVTALHTYS